MEWRRFGWGFMQIIAIADGSGVRVIKGFMNTGED